jgi:DNA-binding transcriptional regulator YiaG
MKNETPTPDQIVAARHAAGHTQAEAGRTVYSALRTWQDWEAGKRKMPKSAFVLYMILTGQTTVKAAREKFS